MEENIIQTGKAEIVASTVETSTIEEKSLTKEEAALDMAKKIAKFTRSRLYHQKYRGYCKGAFGGSKSAGRKMAKKRNRQFKKNEK